MLGQGGQRGKRTGNFPHNSSRCIQCQECRIAAHTLLNTEFERLPYVKDQIAHFCRGNYLTFRSFEIELFNISLTISLIAIDNCLRIRSSVSADPRV
jgi:hypothetical protein